MLTKAHETIRLNPVLGFSIADGTPFAAVRFPRFDRVMAHQRNLTYRLLTASAVAAVSLTVVLASFLGA